MNRSCFALSILLGSLAIALIALDSARGIASEFECGFYPTWQDVSDLADRRVGRAIDGLRTQYDVEYDSAVYGAQVVEVRSASNCRPSIAPMDCSFDEDDCSPCESHRAWSNYSCGHDWIAEEYQPYDYVEDHQSGVTEEITTIDWQPLVDATQAVVERAKSVEISPGAWIGLISRKAAQTVANSTLIQSVGSAAPQLNPATIADVSQLEDLEQLEYWYDTGCDWGISAAPAAPEVVTSVSPRIGKRLVLIVARAMDSTGRSLRNASEFIVAAAGIEVAELSRNPQEGQLRQR